MPRFTYSGAVSTLALVLAMSGVGYAAAKLPKNSVGAAQIKKNAVEASKIKAGAVDASKVKAGSLTGAQINLGALGTVPSATNATTAATATSAANALHAATSIALDKVVYKSVTGTTNGVPDFTPVAATAFCDGGSRAIGGGVKVANVTVGNIADAYPDNGGGSWTAHVYSAGGGTSFTVTAICAPVGAVG